jgi:hypothetical protein
VKKLNPHLSNICFINPRQATSWNSWEFGNSAPSNLMLLGSVSYIWAKPHFCWMQLGSSTKLLGSTGFQNQICSTWLSFTLSGSMSLRLGSASLGLNYTYITWTQLHITWIWLCLAWTQLHSGCFTCTLHPSFLTQFRTLYTYPNFTFLVEAQHVCHFFFV